MKANLPQREPETLRRWEQQRLYQQIRERRRGAPKYVLHDGPPYANGNIHLGTAQNKIVKDFMVKARNMAGFDAPYRPGWDCHGLPIEIKVDQELGRRKAKLSKYEIRQECRKFAEKWINLQRDDFKRLGVLGEWENPYLTMSSRYQATIARAFLDFYAKGYVYKGLKPVNWCIFDRTALAEAEVEYEDHTSPSIWVAYPPLGGENGHKKLGERLRAVIWTTTPWTLPASMALTVHPEFNYVAMEAEDGHAYLMAADLVNTVAAKTGLKWRKERAHISGRELEGMRFRHPWLEREIPVILGPHVTLEQGSGIVHTAPGHGYEDYVVGQQYGIDIYCPVDHAGRFSEDTQNFAGMQVFDANPAIVEHLRAREVLLGDERITHSYPHCWRCHKPTIFRATDQWFIGMERNDLRKQALEAIRNVEWSPSWGEDRIYNMIATRPDWCISRQRVWGVPIVAFSCEKCGERITDNAALQHVADIFEKESADAWYLHPAVDLLPPGTKCAKCGASFFVKEDDILDVWFDSGSSHLAVLGTDDLPWPADQYMEGGDQHRGWFHSSLLVGVGLRKSAPYKRVTTAGWVLDQHGRAMSKSLGNNVEPPEVWNKHGAEILRLWVASVDFREDMRYSEESLTRLTEAYRKIRNTFRFALGNLYDFSPDKDRVAAADLLDLDAWALVSAADLVERCRQAYEKQDFHRVYHACYSFCTVQLSSFYFDVLKDRVYTSPPASRQRRSAQTAFFLITEALLRLLAPIMSFTCEEAWGHLPKREGSLDSVHLADFPKGEELAAGISNDTRQRLKDWDRLGLLREEVLKSLESARNEKRIGSSLEARVLLNANADGDWAGLLERYRSDLPTLFIVSQVDVKSDGPRVAVERASGRKCERCWNYSEQVGERGICERCTAALREMKVL